MGILEPPWFPIIPLGQWQASSMKAGLLSVLTNAHPPRGRMGWQIKAKAASTKLYSMNSPVWIASLPHIFVSMSSASYGCVSAHCMYVVWFLCRQLAYKSSPRATGWFLCATEKYYLEARLTMRPVAVSVDIIQACKRRMNHFLNWTFFLYIGGVITEIRSCFSLNDKNFNFNKI